MEANCLFCKIIKGDIPVDKIYEDKDMLAFHDIAPEAPLHFLVIPKKHLSGPADITAVDQALIGKIIQKGSELAREKGFEDFRLVTNNGALAGQTVFHFHLHVLGGREMSWPPG